MKISPRSLLIAPVLASLLLASACSGDSGEGDATDEGGGAKADAASTALYQKACKVVESAESEAVASPDDYGPGLEVDSFVPVTEWNGPSLPANAVTPPSGEKYIAILTVTATSTNTNVQIESFSKAASLLGWTTKVFDGHGTPQGFSDAFAAALASKPDAIAVAIIPDLYVSNYIEQAREAGIPTMGWGNTSDPNSDARYDLQGASSVVGQSILQAYYAICKSKGTAKVVYNWDPGFPSLKLGLEASQEIMEQCTSCEVLGTYTHDVPTAADPVKYAAATDALLNKYPNQEYMLVSYGVNLAAPARAIQAAGSDVKLLGLNGDPSSLDLLRDGSVEADFAVPQDWMGWAVFDQFLRYLAGAPLLEGNQLTIPPYKVLTKDNAPSGGTPVTLPIDYESEYKALWGVS